MDSSTLMPSHVTYPASFDKDFCVKQLAAMREATPMQPAGTLAGNTVNRSIRRSEVGWPAKTFEIIESATKAAREANERTWGVALGGDGSAEYQLTHYSAGDEGAYHTHLDMSLDGSPAAMRKVSFVLQLSHGGDYCGGDLTLEHVGSPDCWQARRIGTLIVFPSFIPHSVGPLVRGERWSLVSWLSGPPFR